MNTQPQQRISINAIIVSFVAMAVIAGIVMAALIFDALWSLIAGVFVLGAIFIVSGWMIAKNIVVPLLDAKTKRDGMRYDFLLGMASKGALPTTGEYTWRVQIAAPAEPDGGELQDSEVEQYKQLALQLIGVTYQRLGAQSKQLIPFNQCATNGISPFNDVKSWTNARGWLLNHNLAYKEMAGDKCTAIRFSNGRTVADIYRRVVGQDYPPTETA